MNRLVSASVFTLILICTNASLRAQSAQRAGDETGSSIRRGMITGRVVVDGQPLPDARIFVGSLNSPIRRPVFTEADGRFQIRGLESGLFRVEASAAGYVLQPSALPQAQAIYRVGDSLTINMVRGGVITGKVLNAAGEPLVAISVRAIMVRDANNKKSSYGTHGQALRQTDDRGIYRLYGLPPGTYVVSAGGYLNYWNNAYLSNNRIYAPSSSRDTAAEISVGSGEEVKDVDIRYRDEPGHVVAGSVTDTTRGSTSFQIILVPRNGNIEEGLWESQNPNAQGFEFRDVPDGEYDIWARSFPQGGEFAESEQRRITIKGTDITGIKLVTRPFASLAGQLFLVDSDSQNCKNKRRPSYEETVITAQSTNPLWQRKAQSYYFPLQIVPNKAGEFLIRNLLPGQINLDARFFAKYWFLHSLAFPPQVPSRSTTNEVVGNASNQIVVKSGDKITGIKIVLAEGAASVEGRIELNKGEQISEGLHFNLVPAEIEPRENVLRFFSVPVTSDGKFAVSNVPPGRYFALARTMKDDEPNTISRLRQPDQSKLRAELRRAAEATKIQIELQPCQNVTGFHVSATP